MKSYVDVMNDPSASRVMQRTKGWIERYICNRHPKQAVVGHRKNTAGATVQQFEYDNNFPAAHVCPFVLDSINQKYFWLEESAILPSNSSGIEQLLLSQIPLFKATSPAHDCSTSGKAASYPVYLKTFLTVFPAFTQIARQQTKQIIDDIYAKIRSAFIQEVLMLGQFYPSCDVSAVYNPSWNTPGPLGVTPYTSFAVRYMAQHDHLFIQPHDSSNPDWQVYLKYFQYP
jgi:hypothetical protein